MTPPSAKPAWVQLYEARRLTADYVEVRTPGRPPASIPRKKVGLTLSQGEITEIENWQKKFSILMGRKVSAGETVGILMRVCSARLSRLANADTVENLADLAEMMIGE